MNRFSRYVPMTTKASKRLSGLPLESRQRDPLKSSRVYGNAAGSAKEVQEPRLV